MKITPPQEETIDEGLYGLVNEQAADNEFLELGLNVDPLSEISAPGIASAVRAPRKKGRKKGGKKGAKKGGAKKGAKKGGKKVTLV